MKNVNQIRAGLLVLFVLSMMMLAMSGCQTQDGFLDNETGDIFTPDEAAQLPPEDQEKLEPVKIQQINPEIAGKITAGGQSVNAVYAVVRPFVPEPYASAILGLLGLAGTAWQLFGKKQVVKEKSELSTWANRIKLGAEITAKTVDTIVKPAGELYQQFKDRQKAESANTDAIMPDKV